MKRSTLLLALAVLALANDATASSPDRPFARWWEQAGARAASVVGCEEGSQPSGALYRICTPTGLPWDGDLVVYAHGYVAPTAALALPEEADLLGPLFTLAGKAFATTSYRSNGAAVHDGLADVEELVALFASRHGAPARVWLVGASLGGLITTLAVERRPDLYAGALSMCGPYGSFAGQVDYFLDFRVVFDALFPGLLPPSAVEVPEDLIAGWDAHYEAVVRPALQDPANAPRLDALLAVTGAASDPADPSTREATTRRVLWYDVAATNELAGRVGGQPYDNLERVYAGSSFDAEINAAAARFAGDPLARATIADAWETSGRLERPLVTLHTTGDDVVPYWQAARYAEKVAGAGAQSLYDHRAVERYGHCNFDGGEIAGAFVRLLELGAAAP